MRILFFKINLSAFSTRNLSSFLLLFWQTPPNFIPIVRGNLGCEVSYLCTSPAWILFEESCTQKHVQSRELVNCISLRLPKRFPNNEIWQILRRLDNDRHVSLSCHIHLTACILSVILNHLNKLYSLQSVCLSCFWPTDNLVYEISFHESILCDLTKRWVFSCCCLDFAIHFQSLLSIRKSLI